MCKYSLESYKSRRVSEGETLTTNTHYSGHGGVMTPKGAPEMLACVAHKQKLTFENFQATAAAKWRDANNVHDRNFKYARNIEEKFGTRQVVTLLDGSNRETIWLTGSQSDSIMFDDGTWIYLIHVESGLEAYVGVKPTLEDKLGIDNKALAVAALDMSDPKDKPEDEEKTDDAPQTPPEPAREPERARVLAGHYEPVNAMVTVPPWARNERW